jgi:hypothetical protein
MTPATTRALTAVWGRTRQRRTGVRFARGVWAPVAISGREARIN